MYKKAVRGVYSQSTVLWTQSIHEFTAFRPWLGLKSE